MKVDRSFVAGLGVDAGSAAIVGGVVAMAHTFDLRVVAEGVETDEQLAILRDLGCDVVQGYLLSLPLAHRDLCALLSRRTPRLAIPAPRDAEPGGSQVSRESRHRLLLDGAKEVSAQTAPQAILDAALAALRRSVDVVGGAIVLVDGDHLRFAACQPAPTAEALAARLPVGQGVSGSIVVTGEPRYLPDIIIASTVPASRRKHAAPGVRSWFGVPLITDGRIIGVFQIDHTDVDAFDEEDRLAVLAFAPVIAMALARSGVVDQPGLLDELSAIRTSA